MKILIVEDNFINRNLMISMLTQYGECHVAVNGNEAVTAFKDMGEDSYDLICLDIKMPEKDGLQTLVEIREHEAKNNKSHQVKIIMTTGLDDKKNILNAFKEQCDGYLVKPISLPKIKEILISLGLSD